MASQARNELQARLEALAQTGPEYTGKLVDLVLDDAARRGASDVHFEPTHRTVEVHYRLDGVLQKAASLSRDLAPNVTARLKVLAELLTYRLDIPQEGSIRQATSRYGVDMRVSTFPTIQGERVVVRLFDATGRTLDLEELGLAPDVLGMLVGMMRERTERQRQDDNHLRLLAPSGACRRRRPAHHHHRRSGGAGNRGRKPVAGAARHGV